MNTILLLYRFGTGDYRVIIIDFRLDNAIKYRVNIYTLNTRSLIDNKPSVVARYNAKVIELVVYHKMNIKLDILEDEQNNFDNLQRRVKLDLIDEQVTSLLLYTEKEYRKIRIAEVDFSPKVSKAVEV